VKRTLLIVALFLGFSETGISQTTEEVIVVKSDKDFVKVELTETSKTAGIEKLLRPTTLSEILLLHQNEDHAEVAVKGNGEVTSEIEPTGTDRAATAVHKK